MNWPIENHVINKPKLEMISKWLNILIKKNFFKIIIVVTISTITPIFRGENYNIIVLPLKAHRYPKEMLF